MDLCLSLPFSLFGVHQRQFDEVRAFHESVIRNRRGYLDVSGGQETRIPDVSSIPLGAISVAVFGVNVALYPRISGAPKRSRLLHVSRGWEL